jgi:hypothetical protein
MPISEIKSQIYISEKSNGHSVSFLIVSDDSVIIESYRMRSKLYFPLNKKVKKYKIVDISKDKITTNKIILTKETTDFFIVGKVKYLKEMTIDKIGDFANIDIFFGTRSNIERLKKCREYYTLSCPDISLQKDD